MATIKWKQIDMPDFRRGLARELGVDVRVAKALSAAGWKWTPESHTWQKNHHGITGEALEDFLGMHPWALRWLLSMIDKGAVGFEVEMTETDNGRYVAEVIPEWPDIVTLIADADKTPKERGLDLGDIFS